ncbi:MAG: hypothetical protein ACRCSY_07675 [Cetobacterium sp.]
MDKVILYDGTTLKILKAEGLNLTFPSGDINSLIEKFTKENCRKIQLITNKDYVYGIYNNLECVSIEKLKNETLIVRLKHIEDDYNDYNILDSTTNNL